MNASPHAMATISVAKSGRVFRGTWDVAWFSAAILFTAAILLT
jgi:hypothetical protein